MASRPDGELLENGRAAYARHDWPAAYRCLTEAQRAADLAADDLALLADAAWWLGRVDEALALFKAVYRLHAEIHANRPSGLLAIMIGYTLMLRHEHAQGAAWLARAERHLRDEPLCPERGFLDYVAIEEAMNDGRYADVIAMARRLQECGRRFNEPNLLALAAMSEGLACLMDGDRERGMTLLDEAMLATVTEELDPGWAGNIYCHLMVACFEIGDLRRATEWTHFTMDWCEALAAPGPFLGICRVHRAQVLTIQGAWERAERDALAVCTAASPFDLASVAEAHYAVGEIARLRGNLAAAREAFAAARGAGRDPQPGYALTLLAEGRHDDAATSIATAIAASRDGSVTQLRLFAAQIEIALARNDVETARRAASAVDALASRYPGDAHVATVRATRGAVALAEGRYAEALKLLHEACRLWQNLQAPLEGARVRLLVAQASLALGDVETARQETAAAQATLASLGVPMERFAALSSPKLAGRITGREAQVLALVAAGMTNREVGDRLFISPRTVARHLENIFAKLSVPTRAAAVAWAVAHDLGPTPDGSNDPPGRLRDWVN